MYARVTEITPEAARSFLSKSRGNRTSRKGRVKKYASDMKAGRFYLSPHGLCFDVEGKFIDGHHRCEAIIEADKPVAMLVVHDVPLEVLPFLDSGLPRSARDALAMAGIGDYSANLVTCAKSIELFPERSQLSYIDPDQVMKLIDQYGEALTFSCENFRSHSPGISRAIRALVARAWYTSEVTRLQEFCEVAKSGIVSDPSTDNAAIVYRNFLLSTSKAGSGHQTESERYRKGQTCLRAFLDRKSMTKCYGTMEDLFPLTTEPIINQG